LSLGDVGFLLFFRVVSGDYGKPCVWDMFFGILVRIVKVKISLVLANMNPGVASLGLLLALLVVETNKHVPNRKMLLDTGTPPMRVKILLMEEILHQLGCIKPCKIMVDSPNLN